MRFLRFNALANDSSKSICYYPKPVVRVGFRSLVTRCRAVVLPRFGGPELFEIRHDVRVPDLNPNEVLVRTRAVSVNPLDTRVRAGYGRSIFEPHLPLILGRDISGVVAALGSSTQAFAVGQEVFGSLHPTAIRGTYTDYAVLPEDELASKPSSMSHVEASAIPFAALTAWRALKSTARITSGQRVFVIGGGGAVGFSATQLSVATGCHVSTTCEPESVDRLLGAGAEQAIDYTYEDWEKTIEGQFDAVLDTIGVPDTERVGINILKRGGSYMTLQGEAASYLISMVWRLGSNCYSNLLMKKTQYRLSLGIEYWWTYMRADAEALKEIQQLSEAGKLKVPVEKMYHITQVREAHEAKDKRLVRGKVVLTPAYFLSIRSILVSLGMSISFNRIINGRNERCPLRKKRCIFPFLRKLFLNIFCL